MVELYTQCSVLNIPHAYKGTHFGMLLDSISIAILLIDCIGALQWPAYTQTCKCRCTSATQIMRWKDTYTPNSFTPPKAGNIHKEGFKGATKNIIVLHDIHTSLMTLIPSAVLQYYRTIHSHDSHKTGKPNTKLIFLHVCVVLSFG